VHFEYTDKVKDLIAWIEDFMENEIYPAEPVHHAQVAEGPSRWEVVPLMEELKDKPKAAGLRNLFMPDPAHGPDEVHRKQIAKIELEKQAASA
jgi:alkylation response protein AidB-like acyl-CoA dehydrogenase